MHKSKEDNWKHRRDPSRSRPIQSLSTSISKLITNQDMVYRHRKIEEKVTTYNYIFATEYEEISVIAVALFNLAMRVRDIKMPTYS